MADQPGLDRYLALVAEHFADQVKGKTNRYTSVNGNMYSFLDRDGTICLRLSEAGKTAFNTRHGGGDVIQYGSVMRGYIALTDQILADSAETSAMFAECLDHARTLRPKPTKKT